MPRRSVRTAGLPVVAAVLLAIAACGGEAASSPTPRATPSPSSFQSQIEREAAHPDPNFDYGFTVRIGVTAVAPRQLVAACCHVLTWINTTASPVTVVFDHIGGQSGPIPAGGSWTYTPHNVESISYHLAEAPSVTGAVQVNPTVEP